MEADDVIGTLVSMWPGQSVVVSADKDLMQLVDAQTLWWDAKDKERGRTEVIERFGVPPERVIDLLGLAGDASDNIPGVPGIGEKTAAKLLNEFGDLNTLLSRAHEVKGKRGQSLVEFAEQARLSAQLATIKRDVPLEVTEADLRYEGPHATQLAEFLQDLGFRSILRDLLRRFPNALDTATASSPTERSAPQTQTPTQTPTQAPTQAPTAQASAQLTASASYDALLLMSPAPAIIDRSRYRCVLTEKELSEVCAQVREAGVMCVDLETTGLHPYDAELLGVALSWREGEACYIPLDHFYLGVPVQLPAEIVWRHLGPLLADPELPKIAQNLKYEHKLFTRRGLKVEGWRGDPMLMAHLLDPSRASFGLDALTRDLLGHENLTFEEVAGKRGPEDRFSAVDLERATAYAGEDADVTLRLANLLKPRLASQPDLWRLFNEVELPLSVVLAEMELEGVLVDAERLKAQSAALLEQLKQLEASVYEQVGYSFNLDSPQQLGKALFETLGLTNKKKTEKGKLSTRHEELVRLEGEHPVITELLTYRHLAKLRNTYLEALPKLIHPKTGRVHTSFKQTGTVTGRLSSNDPNLQNIPQRTPEGRKVREAFIARPGYKLISADYSQVELRLLAHFAQAHEMIKAFIEGVDVHAQTASDVFHVPLNEVTPAQRSSAKGINFGLMYGMGARKLSETIKVPVSEAKEMISAYFERYGAVQRYMQEAVEDARLHAAATTLLGRRRPLSEVNSSNRGKQAAAERLAVNTPIQGTAADIIKLAMVRLHQRLKAEGLKAQLLLTVHDELVLEAPEDEAERVAELTREAMEGAMSLSVPLRVDLGVGESWAEIH
jgi:DNA polymerase-1